MSRTTGIIFHRGVKLNVSRLWCLAQRKFICDRLQLHTARRLATESCKEETLNAFVNVVVSSLPHKIVQTHAHKQGMDETQQKKT